MNTPLFGLIVGVLSGMVLGAIFATGVCVAAEEWGGVKFTKVQYGAICFIGLPVGGVIGGLVGRWANTTSHTG